MSRDVVLGARVPARVVKPSGTVVALRMDARMLAAVEARAAATGLTISEVIRRAVEASLLGTYSIGTAVTMELDAPVQGQFQPGGSERMSEYHVVDVTRLAKARHRWQHPTFQLDLTEPKPGRSNRCGCHGWAMTILEMLNLLEETERAALTDTPKQGAS